MINTFSREPLFFGTLKTTGSSAETWLLYHGRCRQCKRKVMVVQSTGELAKIFPTDGITGSANEDGPVTFAPHQCNR